MAQPRRNTTSHVSAAPVKPLSARGKPAARPRAHVRELGPNAAALVHELSTCVTEADLVQVLYRGLKARFGYDTINLQVLEREGWYHSLPIDLGVLQDVRRRLVRDSMFARAFANPKTTVSPIGSGRQEIGTGPGTRVRGKLAIWVPVAHQGELIGSVIYHTYRKRRISPHQPPF